MTRVSCGVESLSFEVRSWLTTLQFEAMLQSISNDDRGFYHKVGITVEGLGLCA
jgi:hypothetical protein